MNIITKHSKKFGFPRANKLFFFSEVFVYIVSKKFEIDNLFEIDKNFNYS